MNIRQTAQLEARRRKHLFYVNKFHADASVWVTNDSRSLV